MRARLGAKTFKCTEIMSCMWYSCRGGVGTCVTAGICTFWVVPKRLRRAQLVLSDERACVLRGGRGRGGGGDNVSTQSTVEKVRGCDGCTLRGCTMIIEDCAGPGRATCGKRKFKRG
jgi:hypothetical protein